MKFHIPLSYNPINPDEIVAVLRKYEGRHHNDIIADFEQSLCEITGAAHAVALSSGTAAIHLALKAVDVEAGDYVFAPTFTYVATVNPILYLGAQPVLIDSERITWNIDPELLEYALQDCAKKHRLPKAIIAVHTYGMMADMEALCSIAGKWGIPVIEDAAEALGSALHGKSAGTWGTVGIFSFNNNKLVTSYGGGALITHDARIAARVRFLAAQSREQNLHYEHHEVGYNYQMGPINAACGLVSLKHMPQGIIHRKNAHEWYKKKLADNMSFPQGLKGSHSNYWLTAGTFSQPGARDKVLANLLQNNIEARLCWKPMHMQPLFRDALAYHNGVAADLFSKGICLPSGKGVNEPEWERVTTKITEVINAGGSN